MAVNWCKWLKMTSIGSKGCTWLELAGNGWKLFEMVGKDDKDDDDVDDDEESNGMAI